MESYIVRERRWMNKGNKGRSIHWNCRTHDGYILVTDNHRLQKLTFKGDCVKSISQPHNSPFQFNEPICITVHPTFRKDIHCFKRNHLMSINCNVTFNN